jgi:hypothetical protein
MVALLYVAPAWAQHHAGQPPPKFVDKQVVEQEHKRHGNIDGYGAKTAIPERPFPWMAVGLGFLTMVLMSPLGYLAYRSTNKDLKAMKTVGRVTEGTKGEVKEPRTPRAKGEKAEKPNQGGGEPRDRVWDAVHSVNQWVPVDWVARTANLTEPETLDELKGLADEGYLEAAKDKSGKPIFRVQAS